MRDGIEPGGAPGGIVFVLYDVNGDEVHRLAPHGDQEMRLAVLTEQAEFHAQQVLANGGFVGIYDGDDGGLIFYAGVMPS